MEVYLIIVAVITSVLFLLVDLYVMAIYSHKEEPNTSFVNIICKILIIITLLQTQFHSSPWYFSSAFSKSIRNINHSQVPFVPSRIWVKLSP